jgi:hypothetical protein
VRSPVAAVSLLYLALACLLTWPLVTVLDRSLPHSLLDPLLNCWILAWDAERMLGILQGHFEDARRFWQANIFHPAPHALGYSEQLVAQALQVLPVYAVSRNIVLGYNLLFLSTFVLSGLGVFLLVRELTGQTGPSVVAGLFYAFLPYRADHYAHLQVLSSQWMPLVFFGLLRYLATGRRAPLVGAGAALLAQNLSCGYYLLFFTPFVALFILFELHRRDRLGDGRVWMDIAAVALVVVIVTSVFLIPYARLREQGQLVRGLDEVVSYSADVRSYVGASQESRFWRHLLPDLGRSEVQLFLGLTPTILAAAGLVLSARRARSRPSRRRGWWAVAILTAVVVITVAVALLVLAGHPQRVSVGGVTLRAARASRPFLIAGIAASLVVALSPSARDALRRVQRAWPAFFVVALLLAVWLSFGPVIQDGGRPLPAWALYRVLYQYVPGYDGLRVPARMAMLAGLFLSVLAGWALSIFSGVFRSKGALAALGAAFLVEANAAPIATAEAPRCAPIYEAVRSLPRDAVLAELPLGDPYLEARYTYCSTTHWRPLINGYSGASPAEYKTMAAALGNVLGDPDAAWNALAASGATHVVLHGSSWPEGKARRLTAWLEGHHAIAQATSGSDILYDIE